MRERWSPRRAAALAASAVVLCAALGAAPGLPAWASCVGPQLAAGPDPSAAVPPGEDPQPVPVTAGGALQVSGQWFRDGCEDTTEGGPGCSGPPADPESPLRQVPLTLVQGAERWELGTADAGDRDQRYAVTWEFRLPGQLQPGPARLVAAGAELPLAVGG